MNPLYLPFVESSSSLARRVWSLPPTRQLHSPPGATRRSDPRRVHAGGDQRQCIWLPYPHHVDPWCSGIDFLTDIDYRDLIADGAV